MRFYVSAEYLGGSISIHNEAASEEEALVKARKTLGEHLAKEYDDGKTPDECVAHFDHYAWEAFSWDDFLKYAPSAEWRGSENGIVTSIWMP